MQLEPDIEAYGADARIGVLADYMELLALSDRHPSIASVVDYAVDNQWLKRLKERYIPAASTRELRDGAEMPDEEEDFPSRDRTGAREDVEERLENTLLERAETLGEMYPFEIQNRMLHRNKHRFGDTRYVLLLCVTVAHAYSIPVRDLVITRVFEELVTRGLRNLGLSVADFAAVRDDSPNFDAAVISAGSEIGLVPTPEAATKSASADDEGVDTIGHLDWQDAREPRWVIIGQATCGKSETWERKLGEPSPGNWRAFLGLMLPPLAFLAIPHHGDRVHYEHLIEKTQTSIIDRLRLTRWIGPVSTAEGKVIEAVRNCQVVTP